MMYSGFRIMVVLQIVWFRSRRYVLSGVRSRRSVSGSKRSVVSGIRSSSLVSGVYLEDQYYLGLD